MTEKEPNLDSFEDFSGKFIKAEFIKVWPALFVPTAVRSYYDTEEKPHVQYTGEIEGKMKNWEPNKINMQIIRDAGIPSPVALIGRKVYFKQVMNMNPMSHKRVPSLEIEKIE